MSNLCYWCRQPLTATKYNSAYAVAGRTTRHRWNGNFHSNLWSVISPSIAKTFTINMNVILINGYKKGQGCWNRTNYQVANLPSAVNATRCVYPCHRTVHLFLHRAILSSITVLIRAVLAFWLSKKCSSTCDRTKKAPNKSWRLF